MNRTFQMMKRAAELLVALLFGGIVLTFGANIVARYVFSRPIIWADEIVVVLLLWVTFLTTAFVTQEREQVIFDLVYERFGPRGRRAILIGGSGLLVAILTVALPAIVSYTLFLWRERTNVLEWRLDIVYSCFAIFMVVLVLRRIVLVVGLLGPAWPDSIKAIEGSNAPDRTSE